MALNFVLYENEIIENLKLPDIINHDSLYELIFECMKLIQKSGLKGIIKKEIVINVLKRINNGNAEYIKFIDDYIPFMIDMIKVFVNKRLDLKKIKKLAKRCWC